MGQTQFGRGGGASTSPCGWYVIYTYEVPTPGLGGTASGTVIATPNSALDNSAIAVHMWTDNAVLNSLAAFVFASLAAVLY